jgi:hypothetical protein
MSRPGFPVAADAQPENGAADRGPDRADHLDGEAELVLRSAVLVGAAVHRRHPELVD